MKNVMIVDDNCLNAEGIEKNIDWSALDATVIAVEYNSLSAPVSYTHLDVYKRQVCCQIVKKAECFSRVFILPVVIVSSEEIYKFRKFIVHILSLIHIFSSDCLISKGDTRLWQKDL